MRLVSMSFGPHSSSIPPDGSPRLTPGGAPDRELLAALAEEYAALDRHLGNLPERLRRHWLERILRIERLPALPDRVIVHASVDRAGPLAGG